LQAEALRRAVGVLDWIGLERRGFKSGGGSNGSSVILVIPEFFFSGEGIFFDMPASSSNRSEKH
jgi:hypothetical protein